MVGGRGLWLILTATAIQSRHFRAAAVREGAARSVDACGGARDVDGDATAACSDTATSKPRCCRKGRMPRGWGARPWTRCIDDGNTAATFWRRRREERSRVSEDACRWGDRDGNGETTAACINAATGAPRRRRKGRVGRRAVGGRGARLADQRRWFGDGRGTLVADCCGARWRDNLRRGDSLQDCSQQDNRRLDNRRQDGRRWADRRQDDRGHSPQRDGRQRDGWQRDDRPRGNRKKTPGGGRTGRGGEQNNSNITHC